MAHPRKKKGAREIRVEGQVFLWRFEPGAKGSEVVVRSLAHHHAALTIVLPDWRDPWLFISGFTVMKGPPEAIVLQSSARNEPAAITPGFVARGIRRALALGWDPTGSAASARLVYRHRGFHAHAPAEAG